MSKRRKFLEMVGAASIAGIAGCFALPLITSDDDSEPSEEENTNSEEEKSTTNEEALVQEFSFTAENTFEVTPAVSGSIIFAPNTDRNLYAIDVERGESLWSYELNERMTHTPAVGDGSVYTNKELDNKMYSFNSESGDVNWSIDPESEFYPNTPAYNGEYVFVTDKGVTAFNADNGKKEWSYQYENAVFTSSTVALTDANAVNIGEFGVFAVNQDDGSEQWTFTGSGEANPESLVTNSDQVVYADDSDTIYIIDAQSGDVVNQIPTSERPKELRLINDVLYYDDDGLTAYDVISMEEIWSTDDGIRNPPRDTINNYLFSFGPHEIVGIDISNGQRIINKSVSHDISNRMTPHIVGDYIIVSDKSKSLFGYQIVSNSN